MGKIMTSFQLFADLLIGKDANCRYEARYSIVNSLANKWGFRLYNRHLAWLEDEEIQNLPCGFKPQLVGIKDRHYILYSLARSVSRLEGETAECGVFEGLSSYLICRAMNDHHGHIHHMFDSFEGLSAPAGEDLPSDKRSFKWKKNDLAIDLETVKHNLKLFKNIRYYKGWIPDRFNECTSSKFSFVHIDVDLYQPTRDSIEFFYGRMVKGGILLCDDYGYTTCPGAKKAFDEFVATKPESVVVGLPTGQGYIIKI